MFKFLGNKKKPEEESQEPQVDAEKEELKQKIEKCEKEKKDLEEKLEEEKNRSLTSKGMLTAQKKAKEIQGLFSKKNPLGNMMKNKNNPDAKENEVQEAKPPGQAQEGGRKHHKKSKKHHKKSKKHHKKSKKHHKKSKKHHKKSKKHHKKSKKHHKKSKKHHKKSHKKRR